MTDKGKNDRPKIRSVQLENLKKKKETICKVRDYLVRSRRKNGDRPRRTLHPWTEVLLLEKPVTG